jgi:polyhydroxyalkanoate synthesis regulator phasin
MENALKPKVIMLAKEGVEMGKDLLKENKGNIQKIVSKQSQGILKKLLNKDKVTKQEVSNIKDDLIDLAKENKDKVSERSKEILDKLLFGEGLKLLRS